MNHPERTVLHTDTLEKKYGPLHAIVLRHDRYGSVDDGQDRIREAKLVDQEGVLRTYALTFLASRWEGDEMAAIDHEIGGGAMIGKTFRDHGYAIRRNFIHQADLAIPAWMQSEFRLEQAKAHAKLSEFYAKKEDAEPMLYGTLLEVMDPDAPDRLAIPVLAMNPPTSALRSAGITTKEIWDHLGTPGGKRTWEDLGDKYLDAERSSASAIEELYRKASKYAGGIRWNLS